MIHFERQALVPDVDGELRKRWVVRLIWPGLLGLDTIERRHPTDEVDPSKAILEAVKQFVEYADKYRLAVPAPVQLVNHGYHPSVTQDGWLRLVALTEAGLEIPSEVLVRLEGYGGARDTGLEVTNKPG